MMVNVSSRGARVLTRNQRRPEDSPELVLLSGEIQTEARVVYCEPLSDGRFCIGLQFLSGTEMRTSGALWGPGAAR